MRQAKQELVTQQLKELSDNFSAREEMLEQLVISKESGVPYVVLDEMDALIYDTDFKHAYINMLVVYVKARKDAEKDSTKNKPRPNNVGGSENIIDIERLVRGNQPVRE